MRRPHPDGRQPATGSPTTCRLPDRCGPASPTPPQEPRIARAKRSAPWENGTPPGNMNGVRRGRYAKVKICLGRGESSKEAADLREGRVRPSSIPKMEGGGGIREAQRFADGWPRQFRVRIRCVEDVPATRRVVDRHIERGTPDDAGGRDDGGPPLPLMDDDLGGPQRAKPPSRSPWVGSDRRIAARGLRTPDTGRAGASRSHRTPRPR